MPDRMEKIDEQVKREISRDLFSLFPGEFMSVTEVNVSKDLSYAKVWISDAHDTDSAVARCQENASLITRSLSQKLTTRRVPKLHFVADKTGRQVSRIDELLSEIHKDDKA